MSGGDRHALEVWRTISRAHNVEVFCCDYGAAVIERFGYNLPCVRTESARAPGARFSRLQYLGRLCAAVRATRRCGPYDVIYAGSNYFYDVIPALLLAARDRESKTVASCFHLIPPPAERDGGWLANLVAYVEQRSMLWLLRRRRVGLVVDNRFLLESLVSLGFQRERLYLTAMGTGNNRRVNISGGGSGSAVYVGRLSAQKGVGRLLRAWREVVNEMSDAQLKLIGNDEPAYIAAELIATLGLAENVTVLQGLDDGEVSLALSGSRFFVTASLEEGYGVAVLEALAHGLPCVTFDLPAFREVFPVGRYVVKDHTAGALADGILRLYRDPALLSALRAAICNGFTPETWSQVGQNVWQWIKTL